MLSRIPCRWVGFFRYRIWFPIARFIALIGCYKRSFVTFRIHVWYVYLHVFHFYGKCREMYQPHGWYGFLIGLAMVGRVFKGMPVSLKCIHIHIPHLIYLICSFVHRVSFPYVRLLYLILYVIHICLTLLHILWGKYFFPSRLVCSKRWPLPTILAYDCQLGPVSVPLAKIGPTKTQKFWRKW